MEIFTFMDMLKIPVSIPYKMKGILYLTCLDWYFTLTLHWIIFCVFKVCYDWHHFSDFSLSVFATEI